MKSMLQCVSHADLLPTELLEQVFTFLPPYAHVLSLVCSEWSQLILESELLRKLNLNKKFNFPALDKSILPPAHYYYKSFKRMSETNTSESKTGTCSNLFASCYYSYTPNSIGLWFLIETITIIGECSIDEVEGHFERICSLQFDNIQVSNLILHSIA